MLERHIMQAQARAMSADEHELNRANQSCDNYGDLGQPPGMLYCAGNLYIARSSRLCIRVWMGHPKSLIVKMFVP